MFISFRIQNSDMPSFVKGNVYLTRMESGIALKNGYTDFADLTD